MRRCQLLSEMPRQQRLAFAFQTAFIQRDAPSREVMRGRRYADIAFSFLIRHLALPRRAF